MCCNRLLDTPILKSVIDLAVDVIFDAGEVRIWLLLNKLFGSEIVTNVIFPT